MGSVFKWKNQFIHKITDVILFIHRIVSFYLFLLVVVAPPTIMQSQTTQTVTVDEGETVKLTCDAGGYPTPRIKWVRGNGINIPTPYNAFSVAVSRYH